MRLASLLLALIVIASPALADDASPSPVVVLRGSSAPPTPWYEPPPEPQIVIQPVYVPIYYPVVGSWPFVHRHPQPTVRRNR
ncbi:MAG: hypothetical protein HYX38_16755 [Rhodospirillales bacterium]|nr:hypothetical protein [Rhodospirillales bacterium]